MQLMGQSKAPELSHSSSSQGHLLSDFQREVLMKALNHNLSLAYRRRIEIMLLADLGHSQAHICKVLGCAQQTARHWIAVAESGKAHLWNDDQIGRPKTINSQFIDRLKELATKSPRDYGYSFHTWTGDWLRKHLAKELGIEVSNRHINRLLSQLGLSSRLKPLKAEQKSLEQYSINIQVLNPKSLPNSEFVWGLNLVHPTICQPNAELN